ncbi:MAG TPA: MFS transporter [Planctomycetes bacterium]|nr:MFS transporter [Planctomycetota bacterium]
MVSGTSATESTLPDQGDRGGLLSRSFLGLLVTQFLVALNDNMFRWLVVPIGKDLVGQDLALSLGGACFLLPFVLLAAPAGYLADRFSKRRVMIGCKVAEIVIMTLGILVILSGNIYLMLIVLFLMGAQSAVFSPSKYGSIPEIVRPDRISAANGLIGMTTMFAVILGTVAGGTLYDATTLSKHVLVFEADVSRSGLIADQVRLLGYRAQKADSVERAMELAAGGKTRMVLAGPTAPGGDAVVRIAEAAGGVPVARAPEGPEIGSRRYGKLLGELVQQQIGAPHESVFGERVLPGQHRWWISAFALIGVAVLGWGASLLIGRLPPANRERRFPRNPAAQTVRDLTHLVAHRPLFLAALGSAYFWSMGVLAQLNIDKLARPELVTEQRYVSYLLAVLMLGIGVGSFLAGKWSGGRVEVGIVPFGAAGISLATMLLWTVPAGTGEPFSAPYWWVCFWLVGLGVAAGLYDIPLLAFLQEKSPDRSRGRLLAASNFLSFCGMFLTSGIFWLLAARPSPLEVPRDASSWKAALVGVANWFLSLPLGLSARQIFLVAGLATLVVLMVIVWLIPVPTLRVLFGLLVRLVYRVRVHGLENVPRQGGALLVPNHLSWVDGLLVMYFSPRKVRMFADRRHFDVPLLRRLSRQTGVIPVDPGRRSVIRAVREARESLVRGELVCVFPEGCLSRTGQLQGFNPGFLTIVKGTGAPVIPVYLHGLWGSIFTFERGKYFWKWPRQWFRRVSIHFGRPFSAADVHQVRSAVEQLGEKAMEETVQTTRPLGRRLVRMCRRNMFRVKVADSTGAALTGAGLLSRALVLRRLLRRGVLGADEQAVGILLPPSVAAVVTNAALTLDRRVSVNLNYTASDEVMNLCIQQAKIRHVITSRRVIEKFDYHIDAELVHLEDFKPQVTWLDKLSAALGTWLVPAAILERRLRLTRVATGDVLAIIFTSGSTGRPKGVMLTHGNVGSNVDGFQQVLQLSRRDVLLGILPFFHSFGFTVTLWAALVLDPKVVYHFSPLEPRPIGKLCREQGATILLATPTFLRTYVRRCERDDFASLEVVITGAEKLPPDVADAFEKKFGVRPLEGYGTTELSPVASVNVPPDRVPSPYQVCHKEGTVGRPLPGVAAKVVDLETGQDLGPGQAGMLLIRGPNVMKGYLNHPELTAEVIRDGWYVTGDVAEIDRDGFIRITGRESRFSKIGGEMVAHLRVEEALGQLLPTEDDAVHFVVTGVEDPRKGERLVVLHTGFPKPPERICRELVELGLPGLWIPSPDSFAQVDEIPLLGSGKLDLRRIRQLAEEVFGTRNP